MSMGAAQVLMLQLGTKAMSAAIKNAPAAAFKSVLKSGAANTQPTYGLKVDSGEKEGWQVIEAVANTNPKVLDPNIPDLSDPHNKGLFPSESKLKEECPTATSNDYAYVIDTKWIWDNTLTSTIKWKSSGETLETPISFSSESEAITYVQNNNLKYTYPNSEVSTISPFELVAVAPDTPHKSSNLDEMAQMMSVECEKKNNECWNGPPQPTGRPPTPLELKEAINLAIVNNPA